MSPRILIILGTLLYAAGYRRGNTSDSAIMCGALGVFIAWLSFLLDWLSKTDQRFLPELIRVLQGQAAPRLRRGLIFALVCLFCLSLFVVTTSFFFLYHLDNGQPSNGSIPVLAGGTLCALGCNVRIGIALADQHLSKVLTRAMKKRRNR